MINIGESEANEVRVLPIEFDTFPWIAEFSEVGSIAPNAQPEFPSFVARRRDGSRCAECESHLQRPDTFDQFLSGVGRHLFHKIRTEQPKIGIDEQKYFVWVASGLPVKFSVSLATEFYDGYSRETVQHRLDMVAGKDASVTGINAVYDRKPKRQRASAWVAEQD
jgi:hypothetical protein